MEERISIKTKHRSAKRERFVRIAERRVNNILDGLESLGKCSNKKNYEYIDDDIVKIFSAIDKKTKEIRSLYKNSNQNKKRKFSLRD